MVHIDFEPPSNLTMAFGAPVTEFAIVTLKSAEDREKLEGILQMIHASIALTKGAVASIHGVAMEKPNQYVHVCGWESIEVSHCRIRLLRNSMTKATCFCRIIRRHFCPTTRKIC